MIFVFLTTFFIVIFISLGIKSLVSQFFSLKSFLTPSILNADFLLIIFSILFFLPSILNWDFLWITFSYALFVINLIIDFDIGFPFKLIDSILFIFILRFSNFFPIPLKFNIFSLLILLSCSLNILFLFIIWSLIVLLISNSFWEEIIALLSLNLLWI